MSNTQKFGELVLLTATAGLAAVLASRLSDRLKVPVPALFLAGAAIAAAALPGLNAPPQRAVEHAVTIALLMILFDGGLNIGWSRFRLRVLDEGSAADLDEPDLPGILQGVKIHDGPPNGAMFARTAIIQDHRSRTWAVTASVVHPGIGLKEGDERHRQGGGLA